MIKNKEKWNQIKAEFHKEMGKEKCHGCKKEAAVSVIRGFPVCDHCFKLIRQDNDKLFGKKKIPADLNLHEITLDRFSKKHYVDYLNNWKELNGK
jgi:hypothetical protein